MTTLLAFTLVCCLLSALQEGDSERAVRQGYFYGNVPLGNKQQPYQPVYGRTFQQPYQPLPPYQEPYHPLPLYQQEPYQPPPPYQAQYPQPPLYQQPYDPSTWSNMSIQHGKFFKRNLIRNVLPSDLQEPPPKRKNSYTIPTQLDQYPQMVPPIKFQTTGNSEKISEMPAFDSEEEESSSSGENGGPSFDIGKSPTEDLISNADNHADPLNQWVEQDSEDDVYKAILRRVIKKRRHWKGKLERISSVSTNNMEDMMLFKMEFTYVKSKTSEPLDCSTTFSGVNGKVFLGKMECENPPSKIRSRRMGVKWVQEDPDDPNWVLPLTMATNIERSDATLHAIKQIGVKTTDQKTMYKINFVMDRKRDHKKIPCYTWFEMIKNGVLRPIFVKTLTCEDDGGRMAQLKAPNKPDISEDGIAKIIVFDTPQQDAYLFPQVSDGEENQGSPGDTYQNI